MGKPRFDWWSNVVNMVKCYSARKTAIDADERLAPQILRECEAVCRAVSSSLLLPSGVERVELIRRIYWDGSKRNIKDVFEGLTATVGDAEVWHADFIWTVAGEIGYVDRRKPEWTGSLKQSTS